MGRKSDVGLAGLKARRRQGWSSGGSREGICFLALPALGGARDASSTPSSIFALLPTWAPPSQSHHVDAGDPPHPQLLPQVTLSPQIPSQLAGLLGEGRRAQQLTVGLKQQKIIFSQGGGQSLRSGCGQGWLPPKAPGTALPASSSF